MTGPGRPRTGTPILVRVPADVLARIDAAATALGLSRSQYIRNVLRSDILTSRIAADVWIVRAYDEHENATYTESVWTDRAAAVAHVESQRGEPGLLTPDRVHLNVPQGYDDR